jgi:septal ring factor EnvC (AmiA/AmiB activator)
MSNQNNKIILNDILNYIKKIDNRLIIIEEEVKQNSDDIKLIKEEVKQMKSEVKQNSNDIKLIKDEVKQIKKYINKNSKYNEVDVTNW